MYRRGIMKDKVAWHAAVYGVAKSQTQLSDWTTTMSVLVSPFERGAKEGAEKLSNLLKQHSTETAGHHSNPRSWAPGSALSTTPSSMDWMGGFSKAHQVDPHLTSRKSCQAERLYVNSVPKRETEVKQFSSLEETSPGRIPTPHARWKGVGLKSQVKVWVSRVLWDLRGGCSSPETNTGHHEVRDEGDIL